MTLPVASGYIENRMATGNAAFLAYNIVHDQGHPTDTNFR